MNERFAQAVNDLHEKYLALIEMAPVRFSTLPRDLPKQGVYLLSRGAKHVYVGRSNNMRSRFRGHCSPGATHHSASLAFLLARMATERLKASYKKGGESRAGLMTDEAFAGEFRNAKDQIRRMDFRYVEEKDQMKQALLEIYCSVALDTKYNSFRTH